MNLLDCRVNSSLLRSIKSIEKSLDKLQRVGTMYKLGETPLDYFAPPNPAKAFLEAEILRRNLTRFRCDEFEIFAS